MAPNQYDDDSGEEDSVSEDSVQEEVVAKKRRVKKWKVRSCFLTWSRAEPRKIRLEDALFSTSSCSPSFAT